MEILVAEDDPVTELLLTETLISWGYQVVNAVDGEQAIALLKTHKDIRLLIVDWSMPNLDGLALCQQLKKDSQNLYYIIMLTSKSGTQNVVTAIESGADDYITKPFTPEELKVRVWAGERLLEKEKQLEFYANHDELTGIWNRRSTLQFLSKEWDRATRHHSEVTVMLMDLDHFKKVNDEYGHLVGDQALIHFANVVSNQLRPYDIFGRYGGEEFLVILPQMAKGDSAIVAERIIKSLNNTPMALNKHKTIVVTASIGVAEKRNGENSIEDTLRQADEAAYKAKAEGRNRVCFL